MKELDDKILALKRETINELLSQCTPLQVEKFHRIYPGGAPEDRLETAINLLDRSVKANERAQGGPQ